MKHFWFISLAVLLSNINCFGQFTQGNIMFEYNDYNFINPNAKNILSAQLIEVDNSILINWKAVGDTLPGYYIIFKSNNFDNLEFVGRIEIIHQVNSKIVLSHTVKDSLFSPFYNLYHIVKILKSNINFNYNEIDLKKFSSVNLPIKIPTMKSNSTNTIFTCTKSENN